MPPASSSSPLLQLATRMEEAWFSDPSPAHGYKDTEQQVFLFFFLAYGQKEKKQKARLSFSPALQSAHGRLRKWKCGMSKCIRSVVVVDDIIVYDNGVWVGTMVGEMVEWIWRQWNRLEMFGMFHGCMDKFELEEGQFCLSTFHPNFHLSPQF